MWSLPETAHRSLSKLLLGGVALLLTSTAEAQNLVAETPERQAVRSAAPARPAPLCRVDTQRKALAIGASLVPGVLVHGAGHWVLCEKDTARTLVYLEAGAAVATVASLAGLALTGASRYTVAPFAVGALGGAGVFSVTWLADVYGAAAPQGGLGSAPERRPRLTVQSGVRAVYDPLFDTELLLSQSFDLDTGVLRLSPRFDGSPDGDHRRLRLLASPRLFAAHGSAQRHAAWSIDGVLGITDYSQADEGFATTVVEASLVGRLDLERIGPTLRGSFAEAQLGYAREWTRFDGLSGYAWDSLLARLAFGLYLGFDSVRGEAFIAYDHRRDTLFGGLHVPGIGAGYLGFVEQRTALYFGRYLGAAVEVGYGSAFAVSAYLLVRPGGER